MSATLPLTRDDAASSHSSGPAGESWRFTILALLGICLIHVVLATLVRQQAIFVGDDDAGYVLLARAIREGHYHALQHVGLPLEARYPPGYPLVLAAVTAVFGERLDAMLFTGVVVSVVGLVLLFDLVQRRWSRNFALIVCGLVAINPQMLLDAGRLQSEPLYTTGVILTIWLAERGSRIGNGSRNTAAAIAVGAFTALVRSIGVVLLISLSATWAIQRHRRRAVLAALLALGIGGGWGMWTAAAPDAKARRTYGNVLVEWVLGPERSPPLRTEADSPTAETRRGQRSTGTDSAIVSEAERHGFAWRVSHRALRSAERYMTDFVPWVLAAPSIPGTRIDNALWLVACLTCLVAGTGAMWSRLPHAVAYTAAYAAFLLFWPAYIARFVDPLVPLLVLWLLAGARALGGRFVPRRPRAVVVTMALLLITGAVGRNAEAVTVAQKCNRSNPLTSSGCASDDVRAFITAARFARTLPAVDSVFVTPKERPFFYYSGRRTMVLGAAIEHGGDTLAAYLRHTPARLVVIGRIGFNKPYESLRAALLASCRDFEVVEAFPPSALMLRVRASDSNTSYRDACGPIRRLPNSTKGFD